MGVKGGGWQMAILLNPVESRPPIQWRGLLRNAMAAATRRWRRDVRTSCRCPVVSSRHPHVPAGTHPAPDRTRASESHTQLSTSGRLHSSGASGLAHVAWHAGADGRYVMLCPHGSAGNGATPTSTSYETTSRQAKRPAG